MHMHSSILVGNENVSYVLSKDGRLKIDIDQFHRKALREMLQVRQMKWTMAGHASEYLRNPKHKLIFIDCRDSHTLPAKVSARLVLPSIA